MTVNRTPAPMPYLPVVFGLGAVEAAAAIGVSASKFRALVDVGRMPLPRRIDGRRSKANTKVLEFDACSVLALAGSPKIEVPTRDLRTPERLGALALGVAGDEPRGLRVKS